MLKLLKYLFSFLLSIPLIPLSAQIQNTDNLFHYEMGKSSIDTSLLNNLISKQNLKSFFDELKNSTEISIKKVEITSSASMEGDVISNKRLNQKRNETVKTALMQMSGIPDSLIVCVDKGVAWDELRAVVDTSHMPYKEEVLNIIDNQPEETWKNGTLVDSRNSRLMMLRSGNPYRYMSKAYFPLFRYTKIKIVYTGELNYAEEQEMPKAKDNSSLVIEIERDSTDLAQSRITPDSSASDKPQEDLETIKPVEPEEAVVEQPSTGTEKTLEKSVPFLAFKTNALLLGAGIANLGAEVRLADRFSLDFPVIYSPYTIKNDYRLRVLGLQPEFRFWLKNFTQGHFFGLTGNFAWFNVSMSNDNRYQDTDNRPLMGFGVSYGYSWRVHPSLAIEFTAGAGYANIHYDVFYNVHNGIQYNSGVKNYWGLTKAGISIVYILNHRR